MKPKLFLKAISQYFGYQFRETRKASSLEGSFLHLDATYDQKFILKNKDVNVIFDIGAHVGEVAKNYHQNFPNATIFAFEPFPDSYSELERNSKPIKEIKPLQIAVADSVGEKTFYSSAHSPMNSLLKFSPDIGEHYAEYVVSKENSLTVSSTTLDLFCEDNNIQRINICKMDIQGAELLALQGGKELLKNSLIDVIYLEVSFNKIYESQAWFHDVSNFLVQFDYKLFDIYNFYHGKNNFYLTQGDAIFVSPEIAKLL